MITATAPRVIRGVASGLFTFKDLTEAINVRDRETVSDGVAKYMKLGKPLSKRLELQLQRHLEELEATNEVTLYSYPKWVVAALLELRNAEHTARARVAADFKNRGFGIEDAERVFIAQTATILGGRGAAVLQSLEQLNGERDAVEKDVATGIEYLGASTLMTLGGFWFDVADELSRMGHDSFNPFELDFTHLNFPQAESVADVLTMAYGLYGRVATALRKKARLSSGPDEDPSERARALAARDDSLVAAMNMTGIQSLGMELQDIHRSLKQKGIAPHVALDDAPFTGIDPKELERTAGLVETCYSTHMLICRNILHMAVQVGDSALAGKMTDHIADVLGVTRAQVWTTRIWGRTPLAQEPALKHHKP
jgi:hypothetical protein